MEKWKIDQRMCTYCKVQKNIGNYNYDNDDNINSNNNNDEKSTKSNSNQAIKQTLIVMAPHLLQMY